MEGFSTFGTIPIWRSGEVARSLDPFSTYSLKNVVVNFNTTGLFFSSLYKPNNWNRLVYEKGDDIWIIDNMWFK